MKVSDLQTAEDYKSFLLTYLAEADFKVTREEREIILKHISADRYDSLKHLIDRMSDFECLKVIGEYKRIHLTNQADLDALIAEMEEVYNANKHKSVLEKNMLLGLKKVLY